MSEKIYACLLRLFPAPFRRRYEEEALRLVRERLRDERGFVCRLRLGIDLIVDTIGSLPQAYRNSWEETAPGVSIPAHIDGSPLFQSMRKEPFHRGAFALGGVLTLSALGLFTLAMDLPTPVLADRNGPTSPIETVLKRVNQPASSLESQDQPDSDAPHAVSPDLNNAVAVPAMRTDREGPARTNFERSASSLPVQGRERIAVAAPAQPAQSGAAESFAGAAGRQPQFEVVSIHEEKPDPGRLGPVQIQVTADGYRVQGIPLMGLIQIAFVPTQGSYHFGPDQIVGLPESLGSVRYDIAARVSAADLAKWSDSASQPAMLRAMLQAMLTDRFKLVVHRATKVVPIYKMTLGRRGPKFKSSAGATLDQIRREHPNAQILRSGAIVASGPNSGQQWLFGVTMPALGEFLSTMAHRPVRDQTGLAGKYDLTFQLELPSSSGREGEAAPASDFYSSQIFYVIQDQLGLKLSAATGPEESLVIDHVESLSEN